MITGGAGCLSGDTIIEIERPGHSGCRKYSLKYVFHAFNNVGGSGYGRGMKFWSKEESTSCKSDVGSKIATNGINSVVFSGRKPLFALRDSTGNEIKATDDHQFLTVSNGYVLLRSLSVGDDLVVCQRSVDKKKKLHKERRTVESLKYHQVAKRLPRNIFIQKKQWRCTYFYQRVHYARLVYEAHMNNLDVTEFIRILKHDEQSAKNLKYLPSEIEVHHIDEDTTNDSIENLAALPCAEHTKLHCSQSNMQNQFNVKAISKIVSIEPCGMEDTYDIVMEEPYRNFIANGFIVHNSGKTTIVRNITQKLEAKGEKVHLCAFAGKAAARLREACEHPASTIHRLLNYNGSVFLNPSLAGSSVVVDESSMCDSQLCAEIVRRNPNRLCLVGDAAQLPPVGRGQPFHDLLDLRPDLVSSLTRCYRATEAVFQAATAIRNGGRPPMDATSDGERWTMRNTGDEKHTQEQILEWVKEGFLDFEQDAIICARNGNGDGDPSTVIGLNAAISELVSPRRKGHKFNVGDRVVNTKNIYELDFYNGNQGTIHAIDQDEGIWIRTDFPVIDRSKTSDESDPKYTSHILFSRENRKHLQLAFAITCHRAQGSQYRNVIVLAFTKDTHCLLDRSWIYTAVTRTKESCAVVGQLSAVWSGIDKSNKKRTVLQMLSENERIS
jgi:hypothetical protein